MRRRQPRVAGAKGGEPGVTFVHVDYNCDLCRFSAPPPPRRHTAHLSLSLFPRRPFFPLYSSVSSSPFPPLAPLISRKARPTTVDRTRVIKALLMIICIVRINRILSKYDEFEAFLLRRGCLMV